jgi:glutamine---fructose-6-phosphate transaminase (isomerizing)
MALEDVVRETLKQVEGAYAVCFLFSDNPNLLIGARKGSPLILGIGKDKVRERGMSDTKSESDSESGSPIPLTSIVDECFLASDASAIIEYTNKVLGLPHPPQRAV